MDIRARIEPFHLDDLNEGRFIDHRVLAIERRAALFVDELFDLDGEYLRIAASEWRRVGREDRAAFLEHLADDWQAQRR